jgi:hypothetical protein
VTTRHAGYIVTLKQELREDDAAALIAAIEMLSPVASVVPVENDCGHVMAVQQARHELRQKLWEALK